MQFISQRFRDALGTSHKRVTELTCQVPGGEPVQIGQAQERDDGSFGPGWSAGSVSCSGSSGVRYGAAFTIIPEQAGDTYGMVSTPGAIFTVRHGIDFGADDKEFVDCGVYEASDGTVPLRRGAIDLGLVDLWQRLERCRFTAPYAPPDGTRSTLIGDAVLEANPGTTVLTLASGGTYVAGENVWDRDRTAFLTDMARDGSLDAHFNASGEFLIRPEPVLEDTAAVWTYQTGEETNIATAERSRPFDRLYNEVIVQPMDETQVWTQQVVPLTDVSHPRHWTKVGRVPYFYKSPTLQSAEEAYAAGATILQRVLGTTETIKITGLSNPALEYGDVLNLLHESTPTDPGLEARHFLDGWQMDLVTGGMSLDTRSATLADLEEAA